MTTVELQCWGPCLHHWQGCIPCKADKSRRILWCKPSSHAWNSGQNHPTCHIRCSTFCINVLHQRCHDHDETRWYHSLRESPWSKSRQHPAEQACHLSKLLVCVCVWKKQTRHTIVLSSTSAYVRLERDCFLFGFREFSDSDPLFSWQFDCQMATWTSSG